MTIRHIPQPYIVYMPWNEDREHELTTWLEENILSYFMVTFIAAGGFIIPKRSDSKSASEKLNKVFQFQFECPRDALLFKLTWGER